MTLPTFHMQMLYSKVVCHRYREKDKVRYCLQTTISSCCLFPCSKIKQNKNKDPVIGLAIITINKSLWPNGCWPYLNYQKWDSTDHCTLSNKTFDSKDDHCRGCENVSYYWQQSHSGLNLPRWSHSTYLQNTLF